jgi:3-oxoacyl-(acyl-carrier-protein) synthase
MALPDRADDHRRVLVTGMGVFGAGGINAADLWRNAVSGRDGSRGIQLASGLTLPVYGAPDPPIAQEDYRLLHKADRSASLAVAAAREAWRDSGVAAANLDPLRIGVIVGSSRGPLGLSATCITSPHKHPTDSVYTTFSSLASIVATAIDARGCALMVSATCTSGAVAACTGLQLLREGELDAVLVGAVDAPLVDSFLEQMAATGVLSTGVAGRLCPFDRERTGTVLGEGAAFLVLEPDKLARRRDASAHGVLEAVALGREAGARTTPAKSAEGLQRVLRSSLQRAGSGLDKVDLIHLHGTATRLNDAAESSCLHILYGEPAAQPLSWATKGVTGHTLGASPLYQAILSLQAMHRGFLPGTANCQVLDPCCPIRLCVGSGLDRQIQTAVCLNSGFWGNVSSMVLTHGL